MSNEELAVLIKAGETALYSQLWTGCERYFRKRSNSYYRHNENRAKGAGQTAEDFYNACFFAMVNAVESFDPESGYTYLTYTNYHILNEFRSLIGIKLKRRNPLDDSSSLDETAQDGETAYIELIEDPESLEPFEEIAEREDTLMLRAELEAAIDTLPEREADIIRRHYFEGIPVEQIAERIGVSRKRGYDLERRGLDSLRKIDKLERYHDDIISHEAYHHTGLNAWKTSGVSSVERAVEMAERLTTRRAELNDNEYIILKVYSEGMPVTAIARMLHISPGYVKRLCAKHLLHGAA
ncbi:MAG: sigma-70 family RNA polymerase sigma factor [Ruminococcus sp.]|jgi:RNA polymerase sigma factor (sigma-70 family)|nr:sigma-70 family RNA polymerase sigma factor [Ruminococcus sp.]